MKLWEPVGIKNQETYHIKSTQTIKTKKNLLIFNEI